MVDSVLGAEYFLDKKTKAGSGSVVMALFLIPCTLPTKDDLQEQSFNNKCI